MITITEKIKVAHERLSKTNLKFLEFVEKNPWCLKHSYYENIKWPYRPLIFQPWPLYVNQYFKKEMMEAGKDVYNLIKQIPKKIFNFNAREIGRYYEVSQETINHILSGITEEHIHHLLGRGDYIYSPEHGFKCMEYNISGNLGGWELPFWNDMYRQTEPLTKFFNETSPELINENLIDIALRLYINRIIQHFPNQRNDINTVMVMAGHPDGTINSPLEKYSFSLYQDILKSKNMGLQGELNVCDYKHLIVKGNYLYYKGKRVLCLHENYGGVVPEEIYHVSRIGELILYVGPLTFLMSNKLNIALLSEHEESNLFSPKERQTIKKYIPWSRKTLPGQTRYQGETINLETFILTNREKLVLKPALSYGGKDILIGIYTSPQEWGNSVQTAFHKKTWLVQEYIEPSSYLFQEGKEGCGEHDIVWGIFVFGGTYAGSFLRTLSKTDNKGLINAKQGADVSVVFEVRE